MNLKETELVVSLVNNLIAAFCEKHPDEYDFDEQSIGFDTESGEISCYNGDNLSETLDWVNSEVLPDLLDKSNEKKLREDLLEYFDGIRVERGMTAVEKNFVKRLENED